MGVIPGLVSIPVVKSFCVLFVYYGFLWEFHFAASFLLLQLLLTYLLITYHFHICYRFCGHSMGVIPGLVSIPVVKSFCVLFVYYGFLWEFHFAASFLLLQLLLTYLLITYHFHICYRFCGHSMGVIPGLVSIPVVKSFCVLFVYYGFLWEFHFAASLFLL